MSMSDRVVMGTARQLDSWSDLQSKRPLPVHFVLYASKRKSQALCPCLVLQYRNINIIRILDPEHQQPYISIDSIFLLAGKSIPLGLLEFDLSREAGDYDLTLAGLEPREALWAPLKIARKIAEDLNLLQSLSLLLDWDKRHIWSLDEGDEGLMHNWRASQMDVASYSTVSLMKQEITSITLQPKGNMLRTLVSEMQRLEAAQTPATIALVRPMTANESLKRFEEKMLRWTVLSHETLIQSQKKAQSLSSYEDDDDIEHMNTRINNADQLLLLKDLLQGLQTDTTFAPVSLNIEEIHSGNKYTNLEAKSPEDRYRDARVAMTLLHYYWTLYMRMINDQSRTEVKLEPQTCTAAASQEDVSGQKDKDDMKDFLKRLEASSRRNEWAMAELLRAPPRSIQHEQNRYDVMRLPLVDTLDSRLLIALIVGILLGSAATSRM